LIGFGSPATPPFERDRQCPRKAATALLGSPGLKSSRQARKPIVGVEVAQRGQVSTGAAGYELAQHRFRSVLFVLVATGANIAVRDPRRLFEVYRRTLTGHRHFQQIAYQRHAICAFDVGLAPSARESPKVVPRDFELEPGSIPVGAIAEAGTTWGAPAAGEPAIYFLPANTSHQFVGIPVGIGSNR
jgi:hypothetical protein